MTSIKRSISTITLLITASILIYIFYNKTFTTQSQYKFYYFKTLININLGDGQKPISAVTLNTIDNLLKSQEDKWFAKDNGYLNKLNNSLSTGANFQVDDETIELINKIKSFHTTSKGFYNPTIGKLVNYWENNEDSSLNISDYLKKSPKPDNLQINNKILTSTNPLAQLNINGIITAHILLQLKDILIKSGVTDAELDMGNDLYIIKSDGQVNYKIIEKKTGSKTMPKLLLKVADQEFLSTSGVFIMDRNNIVRKIIDPNTGNPSYGFYGSTVIDKDPYNANVASIALIIAGQDNYKAVAQSLGINDYILYTYDNDVIISDSMKKRLSE